MMALAFSPSNWKVERRISMSSRPAWLSEQCLDDLLTSIKSKTAGGRILFDLKISII